MNDLFKCLVDLRAHLGGGLNEIQTVLHGKIYIVYVSIVVSWRIAITKAIYGSESASYLYPPAW